jgi:hypothetical protein
MRLCVICSFLLCLSVVSFGCSTTKVVQKKIKVEAKVTSSDDGILVSQLIIDPSSDDPLFVLQEYGSPIQNQSVMQDWQIEGVHIRRVNAVDIPAIIASIGRVTNQDNVWHGQVLKWRDVQQHKIPRQGMVITKSGIPHFIHSGYLSLLARSWLVQREDGLFVYIQLLPSWHIPDKQSVLAGRTTRPSQSTLFEELGLEFLLQHGEAILLAVETNQSKKTSSGPQDFGLSPVRLGEAMFGISGDQNKVVLLAIESNILPRD